MDFVNNLDKQKIYYRYKELLPDIALKKILNRLPISIEILTKSKIERFLLGTLIIALGILLSYRNLYAISFFQKDADKLTTLLTLIYQVFAILLILVGIVRNVKSLYIFQVIALTGCLASLIRIVIANFSQLDSLLVNVDGVTIIVMGILAASSLSLGITVMNRIFKNQDYNNQRADT